MSDAQIFQLLGLIYLAAGLGMIFNPDFYKKLLSNFSESPAVIYLGGFMALAVGYLLVAFHNIWALNWSVIITVIGWLALLKGFLLLITPGLYRIILPAIKRSQGLLILGAVFVTGLGLFCLILGFWVVR